MRGEAKIRRFLSPFHEVMTRSDYRRAQATPPLTVGQAPVMGRPFRFSDREGFFHSVQEIFLGEVYRFSASTPTPLIIDAGANIGLSVFYFKQLFPQGRVIAFEPDRAIFDLLKQNVGSMDDVELHCSAVWTEDTELTFFSEGSLAGSVEMDFHEGREMVVRAEDLKPFLRGPRVNFLKIDIEGAENSVIFDIADDLANVDLLFFEYHSTPGKQQLLGDLLNTVRKAGFRYVINGAHAPLHPFVEKMPYGFELQLNISCFRSDTPS